MLFDQGASGFLDFYKFSLCVDYIWLKFNFLWPLKLTGIWTLYYLITPFLRTPLNHITRNAVFIKAIWVYMHIQHIWYERSLRNAAVSVICRFVFAGAGVADPSTPRYPGLCRARFRGRTAHQVHTHTI